MQDVNNVIQGSESAFRADEYAQRIRRTRERLSRAGVDVMIVTGPENIFWLTGQQTPGYYTFQALLLPVEGDPVFVIRQLEYFNFIANTFISDAAIYQDGDNPVDFLVGMLQQRGWLNKRIGLDKRGWFLPIAVYEALQSKLGAIADTAGVIEPLRAVKSAAEVEKIAAAARYVDAGMRAGMAAIRSGADENALVSAMMGAAIAAGSEYVGMEPLVSTGPRSGVPHGTWRRRVMQDNDPVFLEMSAATHQGTRELVQTIGRMLSQLPPVVVYEPEYVPRPPEVDTTAPLDIHRDDHTWLVEGPWLQRLMGNINFSDYESRMYFDKVLRQSGLFDQLEQMGIQDGDIVSMYDLEFEYQR